MEAQTNGTSATQHIRSGFLDPPSSLRDNAIHSTHVEN